jgi:hypothetical protein
MVKRPLPAVLLVALVFAVPHPGSGSVARFDTTEVVLHTGQSFESRSGSPNPFSEDLSEPDREGLFARHQGMGLNKMNVYLANKGDYEHLPTTPWVGTAASNDKNRFDLGRWHLYEDWVRRMRDSGIVAQLWFFADDSGFGDLPDAERKRLIQYGMARLSGYVNTVFTLVLEWQEGWTPSEVDSHAQYLQSNNPWDRLVSVHGVPGDFEFPDASWADYMDIQAGNGTLHGEVHTIGLLHRVLADKPLIQEEFGLGEEDLALRQKAWAAFAAGAASSGTGAFLKPLSRYVSTLRFERLEPSLTRVASGKAYAAEDPGRLFVVYLHGGTPILLNLLGVAGPLKSEWFDPRLGTFSPGPQLAGDGLSTVTPPDGQDWALTLTSPPPPPGATSFYTVPPCRLLDTRSGSGAGAWPSAERRRLALGGLCGIPSTARAVSANVTAVNPAGQGTLIVWPVDGPEPLASTASFGAGQTRSTPALLTLGEDGTVLAEPFVAGGGAVHLVLDVNGYFE